MTTKNNLQDGKQRQRALDPAQSFIVQAPAGSGKTELLTQRYLVLLGCVKQPEEILAITFTKKSAAEMRARIIKALTTASQEPEPEADHSKLTWRLAQNALNRNKSYGWNLLDNPNRLQIQTIDSLNASLTRQLPLLSNFGAPLDITDDASLLYREAVREFLSHLEENYDWSTAIEKLLMHMDNDIEKVESLLVNMLSKRDQWLPYIAMNTNNPELRKTLEKHLKHIVIDTLTLLEETFPKEYAQELIELAQYAASNLLLEKSPSLITLCSELFVLPGTEIEDKKYWLALSSLLLKADGNWYKSITKKQGFPAPSDAKNPEQKKHFQDFKTRIGELLDIFSTHAKLQEAFKELKDLPDDYYQDDDWETLYALHTILRVIVAQLKLTFQEHGKIDYVENAQAALHALGTEDSPTDMTLALDYKLQHILIDEFQDTSNSQYRLLEKLISGWQPFDGRTLFVVGDPMQSIYRFREAEVGLFIRARKQGIGHLHLEPLTLSVNFRSVPGVVNWVNDHFAKVLPPFEDIATSAVTYSPSIASQAGDDMSHMAVQLHPLVDEDDKAQAAAIVQLIQESKQQHPEKKIAILVRSRTHLHALIPVLKYANLAFRALDIEPLNSRPIIQDLLILTRALLHPADRIAWLAILRAPWCGLTLQDLLIIAGDKTKPIIWEQLRSSDIRAKLTLTGQQLLARIVPILELSLAERRRYNLRYWIENTWLLLGGPACIHQASDLEDARAFFSLVQKLDQACHINDLKQLNDAIEKLYAAPNNHADDSLQIMTMHNSKGLEFDIVILPHLERKASQDEKQLLQWLERTRIDDSNDLILAPIKAIGKDNNIIYDYIKQQKSIRSEYEFGRLLYVAATRAKNQLHIFFNLKTKESSGEIANPVSNSLLHKLWPAIRDKIKNQISKKENANISSTLETQTHHPLKRLKSDWVNPFNSNLFSQGTGYHQQITGFYLAQNNPKYIGIIIHQIFQQISTVGTDWWQNKSLTLQTHYIKKHLLQCGMSTIAIENAIPIIQRAVSNALNDARGQWILQPHDDTHAEYPLTTIVNGELKKLILDKTFVDENGIRWIIDFKSAESADEDLQIFLDNEQKQYEKQLREYYIAFREIENRPIRVGLYFPLIPAWREWSYGTIKKGEPNVTI